MMPDSKGRMSRSASSTPALRDLPPYREPNCPQMLKQDATPVGVFTFNLADCADSEDSEGRRIHGTAVSEALFDIAPEQPTT